MEYLSTEDSVSEGSFDTFCMFSIIRQVVNSQQMVGKEPISQLPNMSKVSIKKLKSQGCSNMRQLIMNVREGTTTGIQSRLVTKLKNIPLFSAENLSLSFKNKLASPEGLVKFDLSLDAIFEKGQKASSNSFGFTVAIGTYQNNFLLAHKSIVMTLSNGQRSSKRTIELKFDWTLANANGGNDSGIVLLRILSTDRRGLDLQYDIKLS